MDGGGSEELVRALYDELRRIAGREHRRAGSPMTLQPTVLVGEAYLRMQGHGRWESRTHFLGYASTAMRHVLIDAARARLAAKRHGPMASITVTLATMAEQPADDADMVRLGDALAALGRHDPQLAKLVDCRFFGGLDERETAQVLGVTDRTVRRWWIRARAWIHAELAED